MLCSKYVPRESSFQGTFIAFDLTSRSQDRTGNYRRPMISSLTPMIGGSDNDRCIKGPLKIQARPTPNRKK